MGTHMNKLLPMKAELVAASSDVKIERHLFERLVG
jgi:hypothetical protein